MTILEPETKSTSPTEPTLRFDVTFPRDCRILDAAAKEPGRYAMHGVCLDLSGDNGLPYYLADQAGDRRPDSPGFPDSDSAYAWVEQTLGADAWNDSAILSRDPVTAKLVATDGRCLAVIVVDVEDSSDLGVDSSGQPVIVERPIDPIMLDRQYLIPPELVKAAIVKTRSNGKPARITVDGSAEFSEGVQFETIHPDMGVIKMRAIEGQEFPKWRAVVPEPRETTITFNPTLLLNLAKSLGSPDCVTFETSADPHAPIRVLPKGRTGERTGVIMPITVDR